MLVMYLKLCCKDCCARYLVMPFDMICFETGPAECKTATGLAECHSTQVHV